MPIYVSGDFSYPREQRGSGVRVFSETNTADFIVTRQYVQEKNSYAPLPISTPDVQYPAALMVEEAEESRDGYLVHFRRVYATLPSPRTEYQEVAYTFPGESGLYQKFSHIWWGRYAKAPPASVLRVGTVAISYSLGQPAVNFPTQITLAGAPVDTVGIVYQNTDLRIDITPTYNPFLGYTDPASYPTSFVVSDSARRWRGEIWERSIITVSR